MEHNESVGFLITDLISGGIQVYLDPGVNIVYPGDGQLVSGWFDEEEGSLHVSMGREDALEILIHEYCHYLQWTKSTPGQLAYDESAWRTIRDFEAEAERMSVKLILTHGLSVDVLQYSRKAAAYIYSYNIIRDTGIWFTPGKPPLLKTGLPI